MTAEGGRVSRRMRSGKKAREGRKGESWERAGRKAGAAEGRLRIPRGAPAAQVLLQPLSTDAPVVAQKSGHVALAGEHNQAGLQGVGHLRKNRLDGRGAGKGPRVEVGDKARRRGRARQGKAARRSCRAPPVDTRSPAAATAHSRPPGHRDCVVGKHLRQPLVGQAAHAAARRDDPRNGRRLVAALQAHTGQGQDGGHR